MKKKNFWLKFKKPIYALAPMADVTDAAFRHMFVKYGKPDVMFTEFVSTDGLCSQGRKNLLRELQYHTSERPIVAQIWGRNPIHFYQAAKFIRKLGFDGIDINLGCPQKKEMAQKTCAALISEPELVGKIIAATQRGAGDLPVSVKTRLGIKKIETERWVSDLLKFKPAAITLHARTVKEMSNVPAHWDEVKKAVQLRNKQNSQTLILGNGDVRSLAEAATRISETGCDGVMIGRAALGNPWFFNPKKSIESISLSERFAVMIEHAKLFEELFKTSKHFEVMCKHFKAYVGGFNGAAALREQLMRAKSAKEVAKIVNKFIHIHD